MARPFDPETDDSYHPDVTSDLFLTEAQVEHALGQVPESSEPAESAARNHIRESERINRLVRTGNMDAEQGLQERQKSSESFCKSFGFWVSATRTSKGFYAQFGDEGL